MAKNLIGFSLNGRDYYDERHKHFEPSSVFDDYDRYRCEWARLGFDGEFSFADYIQLRKCKAIEFLGCVAQDIPEMFFHEFGKSANSEDGGINRFAGYANCLEEDAHDIACGLGEVVQALQDLDPDQKAAYRAYKAAQDYVKSRNEKRDHDDT